MAGRTFTYYGWLGRSVPQTFQLVVASSTRAASLRRAAASSWLPAADTIACRSTAPLSSCQPHNVNATPAVSRRLPRT